MTYRHATNLRTPFADADLIMLAILGDYRIGDPVPAAKTATNNPMTLAELRAEGVVGLYTTAETLSQRRIMQRTGWKRPENVLGQEWPSADDRPNT